MIELALSYSFSPMRGKDRQRRAYSSSSVFLWLNHKGGLPEKQRGRLVGARKPKGNKKKRPVRSALYNQSNYPSQLEPPAFTLLFTFIVQSPKQVNQLDDGVTIPGLSTFVTGAFNNLLPH